MRLSERGAIKSAIADGGFHLYPAGRLVEIISYGSQGDNLQGDFDTSNTFEKLRRVAGPQNPDGKEIFDKDMTLLIERLSKMDVNYDIEAVFERMAKSLPALAKRYYGIENFEPTKPEIVEYFFEGHTDIYKDADWSAFNVNPMEAKELNVPVGIYFKRSQVAPGYPENTTMHEANHAMQAETATPKGYHSYLPWFDEGFADVLGKIMLFRATEDEELLRKVKNFRTEIEDTDPRKVTYHYGEEVAALTLLRGRLPFVKALFAVHKREPFSFDWNTYANLVRDGIDPHVAVIKAYTGSKLETFRKKMEKDENKFRGNGDLDQMDLRILTSCIATQAPATLGASEYKAALWILGEIENNISSHYVDPAIIPEKFKGKINGFSSDQATPAAKLNSEVWEKVPEAKIKAVVHESSIPTEFREGIDKLAAMYFILKRQIGEKIYYEPYGGGLPYRIGTGEIRCSY